MAPAKIRKVSFVVGSAVLFLMSGTSFALQDGQARTPPMGWNSWNFFACDLINEAVVMMTAQAFVKKHPANWEGKQISMADVGYRYITIDDCWGLGSRTVDGKLQINKTRFPHSASTDPLYNNTFKWLSDTIHALGLKFGLYMSDGTMTCQQVQPGACNHEDSDAAQFASWGVDYIKDDCCFSEVCQTANNSNQALYVKMRDAIRKSGRPMILSLCEYGKSSPWLWGDTVGHLWRTNYDIGASWGSLLGHVDQNTERNLYKYAKPGAWNDPDMMEVGVGGMTPAENQAHFDLWCISAAPLNKGNDLSVMTETIFTILSNREVIAVNQDSLGVQGNRVRQIGGTNYIDVYAKKMKSADTVKNRKFAVVVLNRTTTANLSAWVRWSDIGAKPKDTFIVRDLWKHSDIAAAATDSIRVTLVAHGTVHLLFAQKSPQSVAKTSVSSGELSARISGRTGARGFEMYVPAANSVVQVFNVQGRMAASFSAHVPAWYPVNERAALRGLSIMRVKTPDGMLTKELMLAR